MSGDVVAGDVAYADVDRIIAALSQCRRVLITTHVRPDGDALGASTAMSRGPENMPASISLWLRLTSQ